MLCWWRCAQNQLEGHTIPQQQSSSLALPAGFRRTSILSSHCHRTAITLNLTLSVESTLIFALVKAALVGRKRVFAKSCDSWMEEGKNNRQSRAEQSGKLCDSVVCTTPQSTVSTHGGWA